MSYFQASNDGGFLHNDNPNLIITSSNCNWNHLYAYNDGGFMSGTGVNQFSISDCDMLNITSKNGGGFIKNSMAGATLSLSNCAFACSTNDTVESTFLYGFYSTSNTITVGSLVEVTNAASVISSNNTFKNCRTADQGGIFKLTSVSSFSETNSTYSGNAAYSGGAIYLSSTPAIFSNVTFASNYGKYGGSIYSADASSLAFNQLTVTSSYSGVSGGFLHATDTTYVLSMAIDVNSGSIIQNSQSFDFGGVFYIDGNSLIFSLTNVSFSNVQSNNTGSVLFSNGTSTININNNSVNCQTNGSLTDNFYYLNMIGKNKGGSFYIKNAFSVISTTNTIQNCYAGDVGGAFYLESTTFTDTGISTYTNNGALKGGAFYCKSCTMTITDPVFTGHTANHGALMYLENYSSVTLSNIQVSTSYAKVQGGMMYVIDSTSYETSSITFTNNANFYNTTSENEGGMFYINHPNCNVKLNTVVTQQISRSYQSSGGLFYCIQVLKILIDSSSYYNYFAAAEGSFIYSTATNLNLTLTNNIFNSFGTQSSISSNVKSQGSGFHIVNATTIVKSYNNTFKNHETGNLGGVFALSASSLSDSISIYESNSGLMGGAIYCLYCILTIADLTFTNNKGYYGGTFYIKNYNGTFAFDSLQISNSYAYYQGGSAYITGTSSSTISMIDSIISYSQAVENGGALYVDNPNLVISISNNSISNFYSKNGGGLYIKNGLSFALLDSTISNFTSENGGFLNSEAASLAISLQTSSITCKFYAFTASTFTSTSSGFNTGAFQISRAGIVTSDTMTYQNCYMANMGGLFFISNSARFSDSHSTFTGNAAWDKGGVFLSTQTPLYFYNSTFSTSFSNQGGTFYLLNSAASLTVTSSSFDTSISYQQGGLIHVQEDTLADLTDCYLRFYDVQFSKIKSMAGKGGAFHITGKDLAGIDITDCQFENISAYDQGGVLNIENMNGNITLLNVNFFEVFAQNSGSIIYSELDENFGISMTNLNVQCTDVTNYNEYNTIISTDSAGAFYIYEASEGVTVVDSYFQYCMSTDTGGVFSLKDTTFKSTNNTFYKNSAQSGGVFSINGGNTTILDTSISYSVGESGGVFQVENSATVTIDNVTLTDNYASKKGGVLAVIRSSQSSILTSIIKLDSCKNVYDNSAYQGGLISLDNDMIQLQIVNSKIKDLTASIGGAFYVTDALTILFENSDFSQYTASVSAFMHSTASVEIIINDSSFYCQKEISDDDYSDYLDSELASSTISTNFYISGAKNVTMSSNSFSNCAVSKTGGVFSILESPMYDSNSIFSYNAAIKGGAINCQTNCQLFLDGTKFQENYAYKGGVLSLEQSSYMSLKNIKFQGNVAYSSGGVIYVSTDSYFDAYKCEFLQNKANDSSVLDALGSSSINNITITSSLFKQNTATKNTMSLMYSKVVIDQSQFINNLANTRSKNIFCGFSTITIQDSIFQSQKINSYANTLKNEQTSGTFIYVIFDVIMNINQTQFLNGLAKEGGAIYVSGDSYINIYASNFTNNRVRQYGGAIYASGFSGISISNNSRFIDNTADESGDDVYAINSENLIKLDNISFNNPSAKTSIYCESVSLIMSKVNISNIYHSQSSKGAALQCISCRSLYIAYSHFKNLKSIQGGSIFIEDSSKNKKTTDKYGKYQILNSTFINSTAEIGGAIYSNDPQYLTISKTWFEGNQALYKSDSEFDLSGSGGALYYTCDSLTLNCAVDIIRDTKFQKNYASIQGGAIYWDELELKISSVQYLNNKAGQYGNDIGCFAQVLATISKSAYNQKMKELGFETEQALMRNLDDLNFDTKSELGEYRSGANIPETYLAHIDKYGQIVGSDFQSKVRVAVNATANTNQKSNLYAPILEGNTVFDSQGGMVKISDLSFAGTPGYSYSIYFTTDGIDLNKKSNSDYMNDIKSSNIDFDMKIALRECEVGEQFTTAGKCQVCPEGSSYSLVKMTNPGTCSTCPSYKASCYGGRNVGPKPGYWRKDNYTSTFIQCLFEPACLGMIPPENDPIGSCFEGYQGILCADCQVGFSRTGEFECSLCPDPVLNIIRIAFILIAVIGVLVYLIRSTLLGAKDVNNITSIYLKILLNHVQLILLTASFNFQWPEQVLKFFETAKPVAEVSGQIFSFDCFLDSRDSSNQTIKTQEQSESSGIGIRIQFQKLIMYALLPFILAASSYRFWYLYRFCKRNTIKVSNQALSTLIIILFLVHPNIVQFMFFNFKCIDIDGEDRLQTDLEVVCYNSMHQFFSYYVALPCIVVWGLGIPFFAFLLLTRVRKQLDLLQTKEKFGFFYRGYRKQFYFWEIVIMYRKIALIFISVFVISMGVIAQALIVFMILIGFLVVNNKKKPFSTVGLNDLETLSLITSMITVYCGLFFITDKPEEWIKSNPDYSIGSMTLNANTMFAFFIIIVISNFFFFGYWIFKMYQEVRTKFRNMVPKIYLCLCLCGDKYKLERENQQHKIDEENIILREEYFRTLRNLKDIYYNKKIVLNKRKLEKLQAYLNEDNIIEIASDNLIKQQEFEEQEKINKRQTRIQINKKSMKVIDKQNKVAKIATLKSKEAKIYPNELTQRGGNTLNQFEDIGFQIASNEDFKEYDDQSIDLPQKENHPHRQGWDLNIDESLVLDETGKHFMIDIDKSLKSNFKFELQRDSQSSNFFLNNETLDSRKNSYTPQVKKSSAFKKNTFSNGKSNESKKKERNLNNEESNDFRILQEAVADQDQVETESNEQNEQEDQSNLKKLEFYKQENQYEIEGDILENMAKMIDKAQILKERQQQDEDSIQVQQRNNPQRIKELKRNKQMNALSSLIKSKLGIAKSRMTPRAKKSSNNNNVDLAFSDCSNEESTPPQLKTISSGTPQRVQASLSEDSNEQSFDPLRDNLMSPASANVHICLLEEERQESQMNIQQVREQSQIIGVNQQQHQQDQVLYHRQDSNKQQDSFEDSFGSFNEEYDNESDQEESDQEETLNEEVSN